jgi:hypothetical protein
MQLTINNELTGNFNNIVVDDDETVESLKVLIEIESNTPVDIQELLFNGSVLTNDMRKMKEYGIKDGDLLTLSMKQQTSSQQPASQARPAQPAA